MPPLPPVLLHRRLYSVSTAAMTTLNAATEPATTTVIGRPDAPSPSITALAVSLRGGVESVAPGFAEPLGPGFVEPTGPGFVEPFGP